MTPLSTAYLRLGLRLAARLGRPALAGLHLPAPVQDETFRDEFGFVFLEDGSAGPFYVSLGGLLRELWRRHPDPARLRGDAAALLQGLAGQDPAGRALALGVYNALGAALWRRAGFVPAGRPADPGAGPGSVGARADSTVGMVGYFGPLVERLTAQGRRVKILELSPERIPDRAGVSRCTDPRALRACGRVLCTASTLVNDTLDALLDALGGAVPVELIGPSGSGLPDPLFARGVRAVGGSLFDDRAELLAHLRAGESWGAAARKYQLEAADYPGVDALLARLPDHGPDPGQA